MKISPFRFIITTTTSSSLLLVLVLLSLLPLAADAFSPLVRTSTPPPNCHDSSSSSSSLLCLYSTTSSDHDTTTTTTTSIGSSSNSDDNHDWEEDHDDEDEEEEDDGEISSEESLSSSPLLEEYKQWNKAIEKALKGLTKKQTSLENERTKAQTVEETQARAQLIVNNLYLFNSDERVYRVVDWEKGDGNGEEVEITLDYDQYDSASDEADALFAQARKLKRGSKVVEELLEQVEEAKQVLVDCQMDLQLNDQEDEINEGRLRLVQDRLRRTSGRTQFQEPTIQDDKEDNQSGISKSSSKQQYNKKPALGTPASNVRKLLTPAGATVLVGRNRRGNEYLSLSYARGNDVWMHARGTPGAHVLVLDRRGSIHPTEECLEFAAHLAAFYSDGRTETKVPVTLAEPKHLSKPRGAPLGAVKLRQEGPTLLGRPDLVPAELQEARAQSGVYATEEYRSADKAKHRKYTKKVQKEKQKQKQQQKRKQRRNAKNNASGGSGGGDQESQSWY